MELKYHLTRTGDRAHGGFTLIEVLAVISIASIIVGLALPAFSGARDSAIHLQCQSNLRQVGIMFDHYAMHFDDLYPFAGYSPRMVTLPNGGLGGPVGGVLGIKAGMWSLLFPDHWSQVHQWDAALRCPRQPKYDPEAELGEYPLDYSAVAYPNYWVGRAFWTRPQDMQVGAEFESLGVRPARHSDVKFPSQKVLATEFWTFCSNEPNVEFKLYIHGDTASLKGSTLACDGSLRRMARTEGLPGIWGEYSFLDTPMGVWGIDLP